MLSLIRRLASQEQEELWKAIILDKRVVNYLSQSILPEISIIVAQYAMSSSNIPLQPLRFSECPDTVSQDVFNCLLYNGHLTRVEMIRDCGMYGDTFWRCFFVTSHNKPLYLCRGYQLESEQRYRVSRISEPVTLWPLPFATFPQDMPPRFLYVYQGVAYDAFKVSEFTIQFIRRAHDFG